MKTFLEISIENVSFEDEILIAKLVSIGFENFWEDKNLLKCYLETNNWNETFQIEFFDLLNELKIEKSKIKISELENKNWNEIWENSIEPIQITENIVVKPSWKNFPTKSQIEVIIDPKMSFGTGHHETTRLITKLIEKFLQKENTVLDIGTGSGILSIVAIKLGAKYCVAIDNDEWSIQNANENVEKNFVNDKMKILLGTIEDVLENSFDLIIANIQSSVILPILDEIKLKIKTGGKILLSGLLKVEYENLVSQFQKHSLNIVEQMEENEWLAFCLEKIKCT